MKRILCFFGIHQWKFFQHIFVTTDGGDPVICWKQCKRCAESKIVHILK